MKSKLLVLVVLLHCSIASLCQNYVIDVMGRVIVKGQKKLPPIKKGDNLTNTTLLEFFPDARFPRPQIKLLTPKGICLIRYDDYKSRPQSELIEFVKSLIHHNSIATLGTRAFTILPSAKQQAQIVDSLCRRLGANSSNIEYMVSMYINPYCISEFKKPYWKEIGEILSKKYGFQTYNVTGNTLTAKEYNTIPKMAKVHTRDFLPASFSLKKYCPTPGNQGNYSTCVGWATAYGARTISWAIKNNDTVTSDINNQTFSPTFIYEQIKNRSDVSCSNGASLYDAMKLLKHNGVPFYSDLNFGCNVNVSPYNDVAVNYTIKDFQSLTMNYGVTKNDNEFKENLNNIKNALWQKKPVLASINCYKSFNGTVWNGLLDENRGGHAICIIGYDDKFSDGEGAVEMMNSWGPYWGNGGFIYVKYADLKNILISAVSLYDDIKASPLIPPAPPELKPVPIEPVVVPLPAPQPKHDTIPVVVTNDTTVVVPTPSTDTVPTVVVDTITPAPAVVDTVPVVVEDTLQRLEGSFSIILKDGTSMKPEVGEGNGFRNLRLVDADNYTYTISESYPAGTLFRLSFTSAEPAYVYLISTDSKRSPLAQLFPDPDRNVSALLDFTSEVAVSIPDETQYIQMDETSGEDYLCVIYSKDELDITNIKDSLQNNPEKGFIKIVKEALADSIVNDNEVVFDKTQIAFKAASKNQTAIPIFIKIKHR